MASPFKEFTVHLRKGETVYQESEPGAMMYVIQSGAVELFREVDGQRVSYGVLERGDFFGEMSLLLESQPRTTSAVVLEDADLVEIDATLFDRMIRGNIEIAVRMMRKLSLRLREFQERRESMPAAASVTPERVTPQEPAPAPAPEPSPPPPSPEEEAPPAKPEAAVQPRRRHGRPAPVPPGTHALFCTADGAHEFPVVGDRAAIGRFDPVTGMRPEVDLSAVDINRSVSRHHALLLRDRGHYTLTEEVGALNGTFLNGRRLTTGKATRLADGDEVGMGMVRLQFRLRADRASSEG